MERHKKIEAEHAKEIQALVEQTEEVTYQLPRKVVLQTDTVGAIMQCESDEHIAVLNFASFTHPGGGFLNGAVAQEESLCGESWLYEVLEKFKDTWYSANWKEGHKGLYADKLLYSPNIPFTRKDETRTVDVITCAAPNWEYYKTSNDVLEFKKPKNSRALRRRMGMIFREAEKHGVTTLILGAWGCGVFGQDPMLVATQFKIAQSFYPNIRCIYAIPDSGDNLEAFRKVMKDIPE